MVVREVPSRRGGNDEHGIAVQLRSHTNGARDATGRIEQIFLG
jgi:hypothetical protein